MGAARVLLWVLGAGLVVGGLVLLYLETPLNRYISMTMASIGLMVIVGLMVMGAANKARPAPRVIVNEGGRRTLESYHHDGQGRRGRTSDERTFVPGNPPNANAPLAGAPLAAQYGKDAQFAGISQSQAVRPDGSVVQSTVERVVARTPSGGKRLVTRKTKTVTKRPKRGGRGADGKGRTHRRAKQTVRSR